MYAFGRSYNKNHFERKKKMKKFIALLLIAVMVFAMTACAPAAQQGDGKDTYAIVCKDASNPYMKRMVSGFKTACEALGVNFAEKSPETTSAQDQITIVNELIAQGVKAIAIAANDAAALEATLKTATEAGIAIVTLDSDTKGSQMFINQAGVKEVAQVLVESIYDMAGGEGEFAILSASSTATNQNAWIAAMEEELTDACYAGKVSPTLDKKYGNDDLTESTTQANAFVAENAVDCIISPTTVGIAAAGQVLKTANSEIGLTGLGLPSEMQSFMPTKADDDAFASVCPYMMLWDVIHLGATAGAATYAAVTDEFDGAVGSSFEMDAFRDYEATTYEAYQSGDGTAVLAGVPYIFYKGNMAEWIDVL